jgi:integrase
VIIRKARAGKEQLRVDEARLVSELLVRDAHQGKQGAIALFTQVLLGLRSGEVLVRRVRDLDDDGRILWIPSGKTENARRRLEVPDALRPFLLTLAKGRQPERLLFEGRKSAPHQNPWLWTRLKSYCALAGVPRVCPHSLRGLHSSLAVAAGCTSTAVASALGHGSFAITAKHYVNADTLSNSKAKRVADALAGGKQGQADEASALLERLRALPPEARNALLLALEGAKAVS